MAVRRVYLVWGRVREWQMFGRNEFDSRQSTLSAFSPLILIVGPAGAAPLPFCCRRRRRFSWAWEFTDLHIGRTLFHTIFRRFRFCPRFVLVKRFASHADVTPPCRLLNGAIIFRRGFIFPLPSRCDAAVMGDNYWSERWESQPIPRSKISA